MSREFRFQDPGEGIHEAEVVEVRVATGDRVEDGDTVFAVETDKAITEVPSPYSGEIEEVAVQPGNRIQVGDLLLRFAGEGGGEGEDGDGAEGGAAASEQAPEKAADQAALTEQSAEREEPSPEKRRQPAAEEEAGGEAAGERGAGRTEGPPVPAAPSTRRLARELGVDLRRVEPGGPGGRVLAEDVRAAAEGGEKEAAEEPPAESAEAPRERPPRAAGELPDFARWGEIERVPLRSVRRATARAMARAWSEIPHVMHHDLVDITALEEFRREQASTVEAQGGRLTLTVLAMKAAVAALRAFPRFNASLDVEREEIVLKHHYHLGVAVATERGLLVPVVRDVDRKGVAELAVELAELSERARRGEAGREDLEGGTFTLTNVGSIGGALFTPIIRHPEVAILGMARAAWQPVVEDGDAHGRLVARLRLPLCLAFDHRIVDGAEAARFVNHLAASLQDPQSLLLAV
jgi:pyruvate dehydrogenase E2 component (dihydrolipoamide acetyltransferase)